MASVRMGRRFLKRALALRLKADSKMRTGKKINRTTSGERVKTVSGKRTDTLREPHPSTRPMTTSRTVKGNLIFFEMTATAEAARSNPMRATNPNVNSSVIGTKSKCEGAPSYQSGD